VRSAAPEQNDPQPDKKLEKPTLGNTVPDLAVDFAWLTKQADTIEQANEILAQTLYAMVEKSLTDDQALKFEQYVAGLYAEKETGLKVWMELFIKERTRGTQTRIFDIISKGSGVAHEK
jgi:phosphopantetheinyl transferase (holo-ACP synthase)